MRATKFGPSIKGDQDVAASHSTILQLSFPLGQISAAHTVTNAQVAPTLPQPLYSRLAQFLPPQLPVMPHNIPKATVHLDPCSSSLAPITNTRAATPVYQNSSTAWTIIQNTASFLRTWTLRLCQWSLSTDGVSETSPASCLLQPRRWWGSSVPPSCGHNPCR
ncbi:hypothetical protein BOTBODRAFT_460146 [Botryobasidium botryosum FD-172 SS1]|uniref:Uncharacterized protein n=1 Tax=Botryobasidium botryosum (strain FD-172 SS1) TaxID=930990 RepID=A0A067M5Y3_BOTB1|nr:hypothetical protein BOTBODRAFT_460146 [Botryobasidium botryosum FD-172 SS1]